MVKPNYKTGKTFAILLIGFMLIFIALNVHSEKIDATKSKTNDFTLNGTTLSSENGISITPDDKNGFVKVNDSVDVSFGYFATCLLEDGKTKDYSMNGKDKDFIWIIDSATGKLTGKDYKDASKEKKKGEPGFNVLFNFNLDKGKIKFFSGIELEGRCYFTFDYIFTTAKPVSYITRDGKQIAIDSDVSFDSSILVFDNFRIDLSDIDKYAKAISAARNKDGKWEITARLGFNLENGKIDLDPVINAGTADGYIDYQASSFATGNSANADNYFYVGEKGENKTHSVGGSCLVASQSATVNLANVYGWVRFNIYAGHVGGEEWDLQCINSTGGFTCDILNMANPAPATCAAAANLTCGIPQYAAVGTGRFGCSRSGGSSTVGWFVCSQIAPNCDATHALSIETYSSSDRAYLNFDISSLAGKKVKEAKLCVYLESRTVDAGACEGTIDLRHIQDFAPLTAADWAYTDIGDVNAAFLQCADTTAKWVCTNVDVNVQADLTAGRTVSAFLLKHSLEDEDTSQAYYTITAADAGANAPYLDVNYYKNVDVNILKIEDYNNEQAFPVFSYAVDGNLTIDFNVLTADENTLRIDVNYSTVPTEGTGFVLYSDVNTADVNWCDGNNFQIDTNCAVDMNIETSLVADGTYYILIKAKGYAETDFNSSWAAFTVTNDTGDGGGGGGGDTCPPVCPPEPPEPPEPPPLVIPLIYGNVSPPNVDIPVIGDYNAFIKVKRLTYNIISISKFLFDFESIDYEITNLTNENVKVYFELSSEIEPYVMPDISTEYLSLAPNEKTKVSIIPTGQIPLVNSMVGKLLFHSKIGTKESKNEDLINVYSSVGLFEFIAFGSFLFLPTWAWIAIVIVFLAWYLYRRNKK